MDSGSSASVIESFVQGEGEASVAESVAEIDGLLASDLTEREMLNLWVDAWGASYNPRDDGQDMRVWLTGVRKRLSIQGS
ncbi:MAG: hypothetical protein QOI51_1702 [Nocardioidaceae bacterium]|nr:hypothetical protein [Nocardioidaceae bacterium]